MTLVGEGSLVSQSYEKTIRVQDEEIQNLRLRLDHQEKIIYRYSQQLEYLEEENRLLKKQVESFRLNSSPEGTVPDNIKERTKKAASIAGIDIVLYNSSHAQSSSFAYS
jgi:hypothetical protein